MPPGGHGAAEFVNAIGDEPVCLVLGRTTIIEIRVAQREPVNQIALVISLRINSVTQCFAESVVSLELQSV